MTLPRRTTPNPLTDLGFLRVVLLGILAVLACAWAVLRTRSPPTPAVPREIPAPEVVPVPS